MIHHPDSGHTLYELDSLLLRGEEISDEARRRGAGGKSVRRKAASGMVL